MTSSSIAAQSGNASNNISVLWLWASIPFWILYALVFAGTEGEALGQALRDAAANVAPLIGLALVCQTILPRLMIGRIAAAQAAIHVLAGMFFSASWYVSVTLLLACGRWVSGAGFHIVGFAGPALTWQMLQGAILYCAVAAIVLRADVSSISRERTQILRRYLIRDGEDFRPVEVAQIVTIRGAQDYAEVATLAGKHLVRMSLAEFEARLDSEQFIRVHRSTIVQLSHLDRLEPAGGGRMLAHMRNGEIVPVSRSGAQTLRSFVV